MTVKFRPEGAPESDTVVAHTNDIGVGGAYIATDRPAAVGCRLDVEIEVPGPTSSISLSAEVRWVANVGRAIYDERGEPLSVSFADYLMPTAREVPPLDVLITEDAPSPLNPLGLKGAGEAGVTAVGAAIASAIDDAIGIPGAVTELPVTPQRLLALLKRR